MVSLKYALPVAFAVLTLSLWRIQNSLARIEQFVDGSSAAVEAYFPEWGLLKDGQSTAIGDITVTSLLRGENESTGANRHERSEVSKESRIQSNVPEFSNNINEVNPVLKPPLSRIGKDGSATSDERSPPNSRAFLLSDNAAYCNASYKYTRHSRRCLVPRYPDGTRADIVEVPRDEVQLLLREGSAFGMFPDGTRAAFLGRTFNNLMQVYSAVVAARACGKMVVLPRRIKYDYKEDNVRTSSFVDCVDFRDAPVPDPFPYFDRAAFCNLTDTLDGIGGERTGRKKAEAVTRYWHHGRDYGLFPLPSDNFFDLARLEGKRALLTYWGIRPNSYRCQLCSGSPKESVVAYARGADIFEKNWIGHKGQPPLDFYVRAIRHSNAKEVVLVSSDYKNPVVAALENYNWTAGDGWENTQVHVDARIGTSYSAVLRLIFCASVLILGNTSMGPVAMFSPNARRVYMGRILLNQTIGDGDNRLEGPAGVAPEIKWNIPNERNTHSLVARVAEEMKVYGYSTKSNYTPHYKWENTADQLTEMITYQNGTLILLD
mmetsp:Transcript_5159/g.14857  ORF Transcript_5159/g.14857 Transcript_5159/m.14857 type:complete len:546 (-) Transcript_5159:646-2283(-)